jgi:hypothetical protein
VNLETMVQQSCDFVGTPRLNLEEWAALLRSMCGGRGDHEVIDPNAFAGWMRRVSVYGVEAAAFKIQCGLAAVDRGSNTYRFEWTRRAIRLADADRYCALFQVVGRSELTQNDQTIQLDVGDIGLLDGAKPSTRLSENGAQWLSIYLPRQPLISHLGFEPQACLYGGGGTVAARVLRQLVLDGTGGEESTAAPGAGPHMRLALYDLLGALFAPSDPGPVSRHADRLFARIRGVIKDRCADPDFGPAEVAAETGISLRYVQKLLTARALPAANSYIRFVWITPRTFWSAGRLSVQVSISAKLRTPAAFATMLILQEDSGIGLVMHRAPTSKEAVPLATG